MSFLIEMLLDGIVEEATERVGRLWPWRRVPDVDGQSLEDARLAVEEADLGLRVASDASARALVTAQRPAPGTRVKVGSDVLVTVEEP